MDIRNQIRTLQKSTEIMHVFGHNIFWGATPNFWTLSGHCSQIPIMWQSFAAIDLGDLAA